MDDVLEIAAKQRNEAAQRVIETVLKSGDGPMLSDVKVMMDYTDALLNALIDRAGRLEQAEAENKELREAARINRIKLRQILDTL